MILLLLTTALITRPTAEFPNEGIYRTGSYPNQRMEQTIVYDGDLMKLLKSISWIHLHGYRDTRLSYKQLLTIAKRRKISLACGDIARFTKQLLGSLGIKSRVVQFITKEPRNGYNDGHLMIEVLEGKSWILVDIDMRRMFFRDEKPLSARELIEIGVENARIEKFSEAPIISYNDCIKSGYDFTFLFENNFLDENNLRKFYKRVCQSMSY